MNGISIRILSTFWILFLGLWIVAKMMIVEQILMRCTIWSLTDNSKREILFGCALQHLGLVLPSTFALPTNRSRVCGDSLACDSQCCWSFRTPLAGCGAHAGVPVRASAVLGAGLAPSPSGQRILMSGCMTARRWAKVLAGGFQAIPGWHVVRGGQN